MGSGKIPSWIAQVQYKVWEGPYGDGLVVSGIGLRIHDYLPFLRSPDFHPATGDPVKQTGCIIPAFIAKKPFTCFQKAFNGQPLFKKISQGVDQHVITDPLRFCKKLLILTAPSCDVARLSYPLQIKGQVESTSLVENVAEPQGDHGPHAFITAAAIILAGMIDLAYLQTAGKRWCLGGNALYLL